jgi:hypothetical protein
VAPPVPIPNTVVKHSSTYNTAPSTGVGRSAVARTVLSLFPPAGVVRHHLSVGDPGSIM